MLQIALGSRNYKRDQEMQKSSSKRLVYFSQFMVVKWIKIKNKEDIL